MDDFRLPSLHCGWRGASGGASAVQRRATPTRWTTPIASDTAAKNSARDGPIQEVDHDRLGDDEQSAQGVDAADRGDEDAGRRQLEEAGAGQA